MEDALKCSLVLGFYRYDKDHDLKQLREERAYYGLQLKSITDGSQDRVSRQEP